MSLRTRIRSLFGTRCEPEVELPPGMRYRAFLSYRSADKTQAAWLHRALERYRVPRALLSKQDEVSRVTKRVGRIFRDRDEARTVEDLETLIAAELKRSEQLVVLCTPDAVSPGSWVPREIELFRQLRPGANVHTVIGGGEPPGIFPPQLLGAKVGGGTVQPLAADLRSRRAGGQDGRRRAVVKIVAGLLGVEFDELWRRDVMRRRQFAAWAVGAVLVASCVVAYLSYVSAMQDGDVLANLAIEATARGEHVMALRLAVAAVPPPGSGPLSPTSPAAAAALQRALAGSPLVRAYGDVGRPVTSVAISARGERVAIASATGAAFLLDGLGRVLKRIPTARPGAMASQAEIALSHDGSLLAISEGFGLLRTFDSSGNLMAAVNHSTMAPVGFSNLSLLPDQSGILAVRMGAILLFDPRTAKVKHQWQAQEGAIFGLDISADGRHVLTCSSSGSAVVWSLPDGAKLRELRSHAEAIMSCGFNRDGTRTFTASSDGMVRVEDLFDEQFVREWRGPAGTLTKAEFNPSGSMVAVGSADGAIYFWRLADDKRPFRVSTNGGPIRFLSFARGGSQLIAMSQEGLLTAWDVNDHRQELGARAHEGGVELVKGTVEGDLILSVGKENSPMLWTTTFARSIGQLSPEGRSDVEAAAVEGGGRLGMLQAQHASLVKLLGRDPSDSLHPAPSRPDEVRNVEVSPDLSLALVMRRDLGEVLTAAGQVQARLAPVQLKSEKQQPRTPTASGAQDSPLAAASMAASRRNGLLPPPRPTSANGERVWRLFSARFSPDARWIAGVSADGQEAVIWESRSGQVISRLEGSTGISPPLFSADGSLATGVSSTGLTTVWSVATGTVLNQFDVPVVRGAGIRLSPDSSLLVVPGPESARVIRRSDGGFVAELQGLAHSFSFSADRAFVAGISFNRLRLWRVDGGHEVGNFAIPGTGYVVIAFSRSGTQLAAVNSSGVWAWDIRQQVVTNTQQLRRLVCTQLLRSVPKFSEQEVRATGVLISRPHLQNPCNQVGFFDLHRYRARPKQGGLSEGIGDDTPYKEVPTR